MNAIEVNQIVHDIQKNLFIIQAEVAGADKKLGQDKEVLEAATNATAHLYVVNPFKGKQFAAWFSNMFNTHPPLSERIKMLRSM